MIKEDFNLSFSADIEKDTTMVIEEFIHHFGSQFKEELILIALEDTRSKRKLKERLSTETDLNTKYKLEQKHTNLCYDLEVFIKALHKIFNRPDITEDRIRESLEKQIE